MIDKELQEEVLRIKQFLQQQQPREGKKIPGAPDPITPVGGYGATFSRPSKTEPQQELFVPLTGTDLMKEWSVGWEAIFDFARQDKMIPYEPEQYNLKIRIKDDFGMLTVVYSPEERQDYFSRWLYHPNEVEAFEVQHPEIIEAWRRKVVSKQMISIPESPDTPAPTPEQTDPKAFIRALQIAYKSDNEISVKVGTKTPKTYSFADMRFDREDTKAWQALIQILKSSDHLYHVGKAYGAGKKRNPTYDNNHAILREISKKIVSFLNEPTPHLPDNFKIFELRKDKRPGTYGPKFGIPGLSIDSDYNDLSKDALIAGIETLSSRKAILENRGDENSEKELSRITTELEGKIILAIKNNWLGQNRAASYLNPPAED